MSSHLLILLSDDEDDGLILERKNRYLRWVETIALRCCMSRMMGSHSRLWPYLLAPPNMSAANMAL